MNAPQRFELFDQPDEEKVKETKDEKLGAADFFINKEDHTVGNLLRNYLLKNREHVLFAGYKQPHPLEHHIIVKIKTDEDREGPIAPREALIHAIEQITSELEALEYVFTDAAKAAKGPQGGSAW